MILVLYVGYKSAAVSYFWSKIVLLLKFSHQITAISYWSYEIIWFSNFTHQITGNLVQSIWDCIILMIHTSYYSNPIWSMWDCIGPWAITTLRQNWDEIMMRCKIVVRWHQTHNAHIKSQRKLLTHEPLSDSPQFADVRNHALRRLSQSSRHSSSIDTIPLAHPRSQLAFLTASNSFDVRVRELPNTRFFHQ